jgi:pyruvate dehydrogenase (quinone)
MLYLGNPAYGIDLHPVDFVRVAEACGLRVARIGHPRTCRQQLKDAVALDRPVLIERMVDPLEPPRPPLAPGRVESNTHRADGRKLESVGGPAL